MSTDGASIERPEASRQPAAGSRQLRFLLIHALQLPAVALIVFSDRDAAWWAAGIWCSLVCCLGTDSLWRWRNRLLVVEAIAWLVAASLFGSGTVRV